MKTKNLFLLTLLVAIATGTRVTAAEKEAYAVYTSGNSTLAFYYDDMKGDREGDKYSLNTGYDTPGWIDDGKQFERVVFAQSFADYHPTTTCGWFSGQAGLKTITNIRNLKTNEVNIMARMFSDCSSLTSLNLRGFDTSNVTDMNNMFYNCKSLTNLDLSDFETGKVNNMSYMFLKCSSLTGLNVSGFDTSNVLYMVYMFCDCSSLTSLDLSGFDTSNVIYMQFMFSGCSSLTSLDLSGFDTSNVTDMGYMFYYCENLTNLDVSIFDTGKVDRMSNMFFNCSSLTSLDLSGFDTSNVTDMQSMFCGCSSLTSLDLSGFDTSNVTKMSGMFARCNSLTSVNLSAFNTSNVTQMNHMFNECYSLTSLDLSSFDTYEVTTMDYMFSKCSSLKTIYVGNRWSTGQVENAANMFSDCQQLVGGEGTTYSSSHVDVSYAHIDGGPSNPGYLSLMEFNLWVGGTRVTSANKDNIGVASGTATFDPTTHTLTLNDAMIVAEGYDDGISNGLENLEGMSDFKIVCKGTNNIIDAIGSDGSGLALYGNTTISGSRLGVSAYDKGFYVGDRVYLALVNADVYVEAQYPIYGNYYSIVDVDNSRLEADPGNSQNSPVYGADQFNLINCEYAECVAGVDPALLVYNEQQEMMYYYGYPYDNPILIVPTGSDFPTAVDASRLNDKGQMTNDKGHWYTLDGRRLDSVPTAKGLYIHNGQKVVK